MSKINGTGLHTITAIKKGKLVGRISGDVELVKKFDTHLAKQSLNWIGIGRYTWINTKDSEFRYINHSCDPNTYIKGRRTVIALKDIAADEEVTMDYSLTEADPDWSIDNCSCGSSNCRHHIGPIYSLTRKEFSKRESIITNAFRKIFEVELRKSQQ